MPSPDGDTIDDSTPGWVRTVVQEVAHLVRLVHDVVRDEQAALVEAREDQFEEPLVVLLPRVEEDEVERAGQRRGSP